MSDPKDFVAGIDSDQRRSPVRVAFVSGGRARSIPNPLRIAMGADQEPRS